MIASIMKKRNAMAPPNFDNFLSGLKLLLCFVDKKAGLEKIGAPIFPARTIIIHTTAI